MAKPISSLGREDRAVALTCNGQALPPTLTVQAAAKMAGCGVSAAYEACRHNRWPALRITERRIVVCTAPFLQMLGLELDSDPAVDTLPIDPEPESPVIRPPEKEDDTPEPKHYCAVVRHPQREGGAPAKGHRSQNSITAKTSDANQKYIPGPKRSLHE
jgi:hypothetical protein